MTISVFFVTRKWPPAVGGMEIYAKRLTETLSARDDVEVDVAALPGRDDGRPPSIGSLLAFPLAVLRRWFARSAAPDILHLGDMAIWPLGLLAALSRGRTRVVISAHGTDVAYQRRGGLRGRLYGAYLRLGGRVSRATVIANSGATRDAAAEAGWPGARVVPLATDAFADEDDGTVAAAHNGRVLFCGRLVKRKGFAWFARAVAPVLPQEIGVDVVGTIWDEDERAALAAPRVDYLGAMGHDALPALYRAALCVIVPNIETADGEYEGFGLVACEAAAAGGVVLAARRDGLLDAVIDGETGVLLPSGDAEAWRAAIADVASWPADRRRDFTARAMATARERYSWERASRDTVDVYREVLSG